MIEDAVNKKNTNDECWRYLYYLTNFEESKKDMLKQVNENFIKVMHKSIKNNLLKLNKNENLKKETINLLIQSNSTLKNVHYLIKQKSIVDANTLLRSSFENLIMAMMINRDENVYNEFIDLNITDQTRCNTKPQTLRNNFRKVLKDLNCDIFNEISNTELKCMLDEFYDKLCLFTHSTLIVNAIVELKKSESLSIYIFAIKQNAYFLELLIYLCLKYLNNSNEEMIDASYIVLGYVLLLSDINKQELNKENLDRLNSLLYSEINNKYFEKNKSEIDMLNKEIQELKKDIESNPWVIIDFLSKTMKKS